MALGILSLLVRLAITTAVVEDAANATAITRPGYARDPTAAEAPVGTAVAMGLSVRSDVAGGIFSFK